MNTYFIIWYDTTVIQWNPWAKWTIACFYYDLDNLILIKYSYISQDLFQYYIDDDIKNIRYLKIIDQLINDKILKIQNTH